MLYRLELENFYSFRDRQILDLRIPGNVPDFPERFAPVFPGADIRVPKVVAFFGANGSGKTNALRALPFVAWFIGHSFGRTVPNFPCERFNDEESMNRPVRLAIELGGSMELTREAAEQLAAGKPVPQGLYRYELELLAENGLVTKVASEILRQKPNGQGKWSRVFERRLGQPLRGSKTFPLTGFSQVIDKVRDNVSVIATLAQFNHEQSLFICEGVGRVNGNIRLDRIEPADKTVFDYLANNPVAVEALNRELQRIDIGVDAMFMRQHQNGPAPFFRHRNLQQEMPWALESHGTQTFIRQFPWLMQALQSGGITVMDELDLAIHALVLPEMLRWFYDAQHNPTNAQLWMSCHSASLLEDLMKEEVVLCEKDHQGRSRMFSLMDVQSVRRSDNLYKKYLGGAYGGIPHVG